MVIPVKFSLSNIAGVSCSAGMYTNVNGSVMLTGVGYELFDKNNEHHIKLNGLLNINNVADDTIQDKLCITVIIDYM